MAVRPLSVLVAASLLVAACSSVGAGPPCAAPASYPVCASARTGVLACVDGEETFTVCGEGLTCLDVVDGASGQRLSECLPVYSIQCDPAAFLSACLDPSTVLACVAPATFPAAGHTEQLPCGEGESCLLDGDHGACQSEPEPGPCDPATFPGVCRDGAPVACVDGLPTVGEVCVAPDVCRVGPLGARCAPEIATPCDPLVVSGEHCVGDGVAVCDAETGFLRLTPCPDAQTCRPGPEGPACVDTTGLCDPVTWTPTCASPTAVAMCAPVGEVVEQPCPFQIPECQVGPLGAFCVQPGAQPCDAATFVPSCQGQGRILTCNAVTGFTDLQPCRQMRACVVGPDGATCQ